MECDTLVCFLQNLLRLSFGSMGAAAAAGFSPDAGFQASSLPSSVSDALEAVVGPSLDDLSLDEIEAIGSSEHQGEAEVRREPVVLAAVMVMICPSDAEQWSA